MIELDVHTKVNYTESDYRKWIPRDEKSDDSLILHLESLGWKQSNSHASRFITVKSMMKGFTSGRMLTYIRKLGRKVNGHKYRLIVEWAPYGGCIQFNGYINTEKELESILEKISPLLIGKEKV